MAYTLYFEPPKMTVDAGWIQYRPLDGDPDAIMPVDQDSVGEFDRGKTHTCYGLPVDLSVVPKVYERIEDDDADFTISLDERPLLDIESVLIGNLMVPASVRDAVEAFEPGRHQFAPASIRHNGKVIAERFVMFLCNRIDGVDPHASVPPFEPGRRYKKGGEDSRIVLSRAAIGNRHAWHDRQLFGHHFSNALGDALRDLGLSGATFFKFDEV